MKILYIYESIISNQHNLIFTTLSVEFWEIIHQQYTPKYMSHSRLSIAQNFEAWMS